MLFLNVCDYVCNISGYRLLFTDLFVLTFRRQTVVFLYRNQHLSVQWVRESVKVGIQRLPYLAGLSQGDAVVGAGKIFKHFACT